MASPHNAGEIAEDEKYFYTAVNSSTDSTKGREHFSVFVCGESPKQDRGTPFTNGASHTSHPEGSWYYPGYDMTHYSVHDTIQDQCH